ncbi:hypothetical protein ACSLOS_32155, partial [Klebsiella pneumoniae]
ALLEAENDGLKGAVKARDEHIDSLRQAMQLLEHKHEPSSPPENPPETRRLRFYGMHEYARKCIARKFTPFSQGKSCFRRSS